ncbi:hypothetical protein [Streptomyces longwoodensis]|uniref:hypothetical protein n=1 Tax=Streptomyces longwoodensis TaxID=68231 RepID=UPI0033FC5034
MATPPQGNPYAAAPQDGGPHPYAQQGGYPQAPAVPPQQPTGNPYAANPGGPYGHPGTPYAPAPPQTHPGQPYAHPGHQGHPGYQGHPAHPQPLAPACRFCGGSPAVPVTFRAHRGLLVVMTFRKLDGPMCGTCGVAVYRALTTETLWQGWWSPFSLFLFTPFTLIHNLVVSRKVKKLQAPAPGQHGRQVDPGVPVHRRPLAYVGLVPVLWLLFMIVSGLTG